MSGATPSQLAPVRARRKNQIGRYELLAKLASGGMATVYLGRIAGVAGFDRRVALKLLHPHLAEEQDVRDMFLDEARLAARIRHPNVVPVIDVGNDDVQGTYLVMEYIEGADLAAVLRAASKQRIPMPTRVALRILVDALGGLEAAHELRDTDGNPMHLVHRDISPHNIMIGTDGVSRITDFGIAKAEGRVASTRTGQLKGKLAYIAPERLSGLRHRDKGQTSGDQVGDIFGLGVVLWEVLCGRRLFKGQDDLETAQKILTQQIPKPSEVNPGLEAIDQVVLDSLARNPDERLPSARAFREVLEAVAPQVGDIGRISEVKEFMEQVLHDRLIQQRASIEAAVKAVEEAKEAQQHLTTSGNFPSAQVEEPTMVTPANSYQTNAQQFYPTQSIAHAPAAGHTGQFPAQGSSQYQLTNSSSQIAMPNVAQPAKSSQIWQLLTFALVLLLVLGGGFFMWRLTEKMNATASPAAPVAPAATAPAPPVPDTVQMNLGGVPTVPAIPTEVEEPSTVEATMEAEDLAADETEDEAASEMAAEVDTTERRRRPRRPRRPRGSEPSSMMAEAAATMEPTMAAPTMEPPPDMSASMTPTFDNPYGF